MFESYKDLVRLFKIHIGIYGGVKALIISPFLHISLLLTFILYPLWIVEKWWDIVIAILPNLIGFSLGGFAILLAIGGSKFLSLISGEENKEKHSPFMGMSSSLFHFIFIQILALIAAILCKGLYVEVPSFLKYLIGLLNIPLKTYIGLSQNVFWFLGFLLFMYSIISAIAVAFTIFRLTRWFDLFATKEKQEDKKDIHPPTINQMNTDNN